MKVSSLCIFNIFSHISLWNGSSREAGTSLSFSHLCLQWLVRHLMQSRAPQVVLNDYSSIPPSIYASEPVAHHPMVMLRQGPPIFSLRVKNTSYPDQSQLKGSSWWHLNICWKFINSNNKKMTGNIYWTSVRCQALHCFICFNTFNVCNNFRIVYSILTLR